MDNRTKREIQNYNKALITFSSNILWLFLMAIGANYESVLIYLVGFFGIMFSSLAMFWFGHCLGWEQKRISIEEEKNKNGKHDIQNKKSD